MDNNVNNNSNVTMNEQQAQVEDKKSFISGVWEMTKKAAVATKDFTTSKKGMIIEGSLLAAGIVTMVVVKLKKGTAENK